MNHTEFALSWYPAMTIMSKVAKMPETWRETGPRAARVLHGPPIQTAAGLTGVVFAPSYDVQYNHTIYEICQ